jgi:hypothetical protein
MVLSISLGLEVGLMINNFPFVFQSDPGENVVKLGLQLHLDPVVYDVFFGSQNRE